MYVKINTQIEEIYYHVTLNGNNPDFESKISINFFSELYELLIPNLVLCLLYIKLVCQSN